MHYKIFLLTGVHRIKNLKVKKPTVFECRDSFYAKLWNLWQFRQCTVFPGMFLGRLTLLAFCHVDNDHSRIPPQREHRIVGQISVSHPCQQHCYKLKSPCARKNKPNIFVLPNRAYKIQHNNLYRRHTKNLHKSRVIVKMMAEWRVEINLFIQTCLYVWMRISHSE